jgi:phosphoribosyl 1,2-cyclic phosphodiesterase
VQVEFWGVRGSIACGGPAYAVYGGNTSCVAIRSGGHVLIIDAGTGLRPLGDALVREGARHLHLLLSHTHFDHVCGFPFFAPAYDPATDLTVWSGHLDGGAAGSTRAVMGRLMEAPLFPVDPEIFRAKLSYRDFVPGADIPAYSGIRVRTVPLHHPNGASAYRIDAGGKSVVYASDHEHGASDADAQLLTFCHGADLLIYDCTYTEETYRAHQGWGHSTWQAGIAIAAAAKVKALALYHHDPASTDAVLSRIENAAMQAGRKAGVKAFAAKEGAIWTG